MKHLNNSKVIIVLSTMLATFIIFFSYPQDVHGEENFSVQSKAAIAIDAQTGKIFYEHNSEEPLPIASMTKLLTLYVVMEAIQNGEISWDDTITIDEHLDELSHDMELSNIPLTLGNSYTVRDLFNATEIISANAAAIALAEKIAGSEKDFIDRMRAKVQSWGIDDAYLISTSGINNEDARGRYYPGSGEHEENLMSAKSMAIAAQHLILDFPDFLETTKKSTELFAQGTNEEVEMTSWNTMLPGLENEKIGVDGLKTGTTNLAGACFTGTIDRNGWRLITVVMNVNNAEEDNNIRFTETASLMDYVYDNWQRETLYHKGDVVPTISELTVDKGQEFSVPLCLTDDIIFWTRKDMTKQNLAISFQRDKELVHKDNSINAPVFNNEIVGKVIFELPEDTLGYVQKKQHFVEGKLQTTASVEKASWFTLVVRSVKDFFTNLI